MVAHGRPRNSIYAKQCHSHGRRRESNEWDNHQLIGFYNTRLEIEWLFTRRKYSERSSAIRDGAQRQHVAENHLRMPQKCDRAQSVAMQIEPRCGHFFAARLLLLPIRGALASLQLDTVPPSTAEIKRLGRERQLRAIKLPQVRSNPTLFYSLSTRERRHPFTFWSAFRHAIRI